ncbi:hypothetical protein QWY93_19355 [Echinicola jeungdonensis]|uniref:hypothetical protein n=1 Tax=Echinicola jeungdonensis TaxID=709343 RepID=UPI0025B3F198|nr:hypothetical protein [Echinicola jeungdonensis]MDN3671414.1 hypothetical protein [Echinicola jeungdonensis]
MPDLINSFDGGCTTFLDAGQVTDDPGECADSHFAIFNLKKHFVLRAGKKARLFLPISN